jgi:hypothetical protein
MQPPPWHYVGNSDPQRLAALEEPQPYAELVGALQCGLTLRCFHREPREHDASYERAVFCGTVDSYLFDWFFNASTGYRGAFYEAPDAGTRANRTLLNHLTQFLLNWALSQQPDCDRSWILASLSRPSAKAWLAEYPGLCPSCAGEWDPSYVAELHIQNNRWEDSTHVHAAWGRQAPRLTKIRIFGGFIDEHHREWLAPHKAERATHICEYGWS